MIDPRVKKMQVEDPEGLKVFAAIMRSMGEEDPVDHLSDAEVATAMLELQDLGLVTWGIDADSEEVFAELHSDPPENVTRLSRRERRQKRRGR